MKVPSIEEKKEGHVKVPSFEKMMSTWRLIRETKNGDSHV
jgi:hypothetical protein